MNLGTITDTIPSLGYAVSTFQLTLVRPLRDQSVLGILESLRRDLKLYNFVTDRSSFTVMADGPRWRVETLACTRHLNSAGSKEGAPV